MVMRPVQLCIRGIIPAENMLMVGTALYFAAQERRWYYGHGEEMQCSCGENLLTTQDKKVSIARSSAMSLSIGAAYSFDKRARLLIASGLIAGVIPTSMRRALGQLTLDFVSSKPDGKNVVIPKEG